MLWERKSCWKQKEIPYALPTCFASLLTSLSSSTSLRRLEHIDRQRRSIPRERCGTRTDSIHTAFPCCLHTLDHKRISSTIIRCHCFIYDSNIYVPSLAWQLRRINEIGHEGAAHRQTASGVPNNFIDARIRWTPKITAKPIIKPRDSWTSYAENFQSSLSSTQWHKQ